MSRTPDDQAHWRRLAEVAARHGGDRQGPGKVDAAAALLADGGLDPVEAAPLFDDLLDWPVLARLVGLPVGRLRRRSPAEVEALVALADAAHAPGAVPSGPHAAGGGGCVD